jgi:hypothetical protein
VTSHANGGKSNNLCTIFLRIWVIVAKSIETRMSLTLKITNLRHCKQPIYPTCLRSPQSSYYPYFSTEYFPHSTEDFYS